MAAAVSPEEARLEELTDENLRRFHDPRELTREPAPKTRARRAG